MHPELIILICGTRPGVIPTPMLGKSPYLADTKPRYSKRVSAWESMCHQYIHAWRVPCTDGSALVPHTQTLLVPLVHKVVSLAHLGIVKERRYSLLVWLPALQTPIQFLGPLLRVFSWYKCVGLTRLLLKPIRTARTLTEICGHPTPSLSLVPSMAARPIKDILSLFLLRAPPVPNLNSCPKIHC